MKAFATKDETGEYVVAFERDEDDGNIKTVHLDFSLVVGEDTKHVRQLLSEVDETFGRGLERDRYFEGSLNSLIEALGNEEESKRVPGAE